MSQSSRRAFLGQLGSAAVAIPGLSQVRFGGAEITPAAAGVQGASNGAAMYDLVFKGGRVIDPSQNLSAERDVAVLAGRIARIDANIPAAQARWIYDAKGKLVTPGLIDLHTHVYKYGINIQVDPDIVGFGSGVTTLVDAGSTGAGTFMAFRKYVMEPHPTRIYALLNISTIGLVVTNEIYLDPRMVDARAAIRTINANRDRILGVKVRVNGRHEDLQHDLGVMKVAREVADATGLPIMMHWSVERELLAMLKKGDILAHPFNPSSTFSANLFGADGQQAETVLPAILELKDRGIWTDVQLGTTHHDWNVSEKAMKLGWRPDIISTDISRGLGSGGTEPASVLVPMSEFLHLGMPLEEVIACCTSTPAKALNYPEKIGTLAPGTTADVAVLELAQGSFNYPDQVRATRTLKQHFVAAATLQGGTFLKGAPPPAPNAAPQAPPAAAPTAGAPRR
ncbi:MAG: amidohydrolase family protein [Vicinamibacterales bacterium]